MDWESLGPVTALLGVLGSGIAWAVGIWMRRVERREDRMIEMLKTAKAEAETEREAERRDRIMWERRAIAWYRQLVDAGIEPKPPWGED
ncbi:hypothetical protein M3G50_07280 [Brachybacterium muris]|uniref:hypothetical protein n=1 Tax=Brachybacterium muris TaxID=219301 RepID=UPI0021A955FF|nr:hypothetical protein [Brachybacterium muris]MCT1430554.1 hypothetical protein [Brachybacterium muris]